MSQEKIDISPLARFEFDVRTLATNLGAVLELVSKGMKTITKEDFVKYKDELKRLDVILENHKSETDVDTMYELLNEANSILNKLKLEQK